MKKLKETFIGKDEITDIDTSPPFWDLGVDVEEPNEVEYCKELDYDIPSVSINELETLLTKWKEKGANRVYLVEHVDHRGYEFEFVNLTNT